MLLLASPGPATGFEPPYESLNAATLLPERTMTGPGYRIQPEVVNRGLMNHYTIDTRFGGMRARSDRKLEQRLQEIRALGELARMREPLLVAESAGEAFMGTVQSVARVLKDPVGTARGVRQGIQRLMRRSGRRISNAYEDVKRSVADDDTQDAGKPVDGADLSDKAMAAGRRFARNRLGVSRAYRDLAREVGVDPYTDNRILRAELERLANYAAGASLGSRLVIPRIPGLIGAVENVSDLVWTKDRLDLLLHNEDTLERLAVPGEVIERFTDNESYSPTQQTSIVSAVASMEAVTNHWRLIEYAGYADRAAEADFYTAMVALLALYHKNRGVLDTIHPTATIVPIALTIDRRAIVAFPVDRLRWTRDVATIMQGLAESPAGGSGHREIWITGEMSAAGRDGLSRHGWIPFTHAHQRLPNS